LLILFSFDNPTGVTILIGLTGLTGLTGLVIGTVIGLWYITGGLFVLLTLIFGTL